METLVDRPVSVTRTIASSPDEASAIADPVRAAILALLYRRTLTAEQIFERLGRRGKKKALTTVRHHIDVLRSAGLVDIVKVVESRGGVTKHYGTSTRLLMQNPQDDFDEQHSDAIAAAAVGLAAIIESAGAKIAPKDGKKRVDPAHRHYVVAEILNRAMTAAMERGSRAPSGS